MVLSNAVELMILKNILSNLLKVPLNKKSGYQDLSYTYLVETTESEVQITEEQFMMCLPQIELLLIKTMLADIYKEPITSLYFIEMICFKFFGTQAGVINAEERFKIFSMQTDEPEVVKRTLLEIAESYKAMVSITI